MYACMHVCMYACMYVHIHKIYIEHLEIYNEDEQEKEKEEGRSDYWQTEWETDKRENEKRQKEWWQRDRRGATGNGWTESLPAVGAAVGFLCLSSTVVTLEGF